MAPHGQDPGLRQSTPVPEADTSMNEIGRRTRISIERSLVMEELQQLMTYCKNVLKESNVKQIDWMQATLEFITSHFETLSSLNREIWLTIQDIEELRRDRAQQNTISLDVRLILCKLKRRIENDEPRVGTANSATDQCVRMTQQKCCEISKNARKLEPLKMDKFDGKLENWIPWWTRFEERIHKDGQLTNRTKYDYLLQYLTKEVKEKLKTIPLDEEFYETAVGRLKADFGSFEKLRSLYTQRLLQLKPVQSPYDMTGLRELLQIVHTSMSALDKVGLPKDAVVPLVFTRVKEVIPVDTYLDFKKTTRAEGTDDVSSTSIITLDRLEKFLKFIEQAVSDLDDIEERQLQRKNESTERRFTATALKAEVKARDLRESNDNRKKSNTRERFQAAQPCVLCKSGDHRTQDCTDASMTIQQRREILKKEDRCCKCAKKGHYAAACRTATLCDRCKKKGHMTSLCNPTATITAHHDSKGTTIASHMCRSDQLSTQYYMTVMATAIGPDGRRGHVRILFDSGSQRSFIRTETAEQLGINMRTLQKIPVSLKMLNQATVITSTALVEIRLQNREGGPVERFKFYTLDQICSEQVQPQVDPVSKKQLRELKIKLSDDHNVHTPIDILIGTDQLVSMQTHRAHRLEKTLEVVETVFGWALFGCRSQITEQRITVNHAQITCLQCSVPQMAPLPQVDSLDQGFREFVEADAFAIEEETRDKDQRSLEEFVENIAFDAKDHRFIVQLPFKENLLPSPNLALAKARLTSLEKSLDKSGIREKYESELKTLMDLEFIEKVDQQREPEGPISYLPHKEVIKEDSLTTKLRIVFDASAKEKGALSLNDTLHNGPNLTQDMLAVLLRFRNHRIVLLADIEKSFPQVIIQEKHRDALRFLWRMERKGDPQIYRLTRNYLGLASSSFILAACLQLLLRWFEATYPETVTAIKRNYYVDDIATGAQSEEKAFKLYKETKEIFNHGSFNLRKWTSNSPKLMSEFRRNGESVEEFCVSSWYNVLGLQYNPKSDSIRLKVSTFNTGFKLVTKRTVLSVIASVFDRIGFAAPLLVPAKLLIQKMWKLNLLWDDPIPEQMAIDFKAWAAELDNLGSVIIPRRYDHQEGQTDRTLHVFCDASGYAYGFCAYLVTKSSQGTTSSLMLAKSRVAPLKNATIPRLELMALTLAAEATAYLREQCEFAFDEEHIWTDNSGVFFQATSENPEKLATFARNRVRKIQLLKQNAEIHHVPGSLNPADLVSRGCTFREYVESNWLIGPEFIRGPKESWPQLQNHSTGNDAMSTLDPKRVMFGSFVVMRPEQPMEAFVHHTTYDRLPTVILGFHTCSRWSIYLRAIVRFRRAIEYWRKRMTRAELHKPILCRELEQTETFIVSQAQADAYPIELRALSQGTELPKASPLRVYSLFIQDGVLRVGGRLGEHVGELPKHPIILPTKHQVTKMILQDLHERSCHAGPSHVLMEARQKYWIPQGTRVIRNLVHECGNCRKFHTRPLSAAMGPPPDVRVTKSQPFEHVGTDVLGPLYVKDGTEQKKIWVVIFTCCAMRAIHLEILESMSTVEFLMSMRRFKARRGCPRTFYSDNAKAYKRASEDLKALCEIMSNTAVQERLARDGVEWRFSIERAPWYMGFTERLVGSVKTALKKVLGRAAVNWQEMSTVLCEVEMMLNKRPLCQVPESENIDVLTPAHFLINRTEDPTQDSNAPNKLKASDLLRRWRHKKSVVEAVWKRWEHEYLLLLRNFHESVPKDMNDVSVGQIVIIKDHNKPKLSWKMGRIEKLNRSRDQVVRSCLLTVSDGKRLQRPISLLYPLEIT